jgi:hypothetical protein
VNQVIKEEWCRRLRSGEYKQAQGVLTRLNAQGEITGHCCLGVLMEMAVEEGVTHVDSRPADPFSPPSEYRYYTDDPDSPIPVINASTLTETVVIWAGLKLRNPAIGLRASDGVLITDHYMYPRNRETEFDTLSGANDVATLSFNTIADIIEEAL